MEAPVLELAHVLERERAEDLELADAGEVEQVVLNSVRKYTLNPSVTMESEFDADMKLTTPARQMLFAYRPVEHAVISCVSTTTVCDCGDVLVMNA